MTVPKAGSRGGAPRPSADPRPEARLLVDAIQQVEGQEYPWAEMNHERLLIAALRHGVAPGKPPDQGCKLVAASGSRRELSRQLLQQVDTAIH